MDLGTYHRDTDGALRDSFDIEKMGFEIGNTQTKNLKSFKYHDSFQYFLPRDLIPCILKDNSGIQEMDANKLAKSYAKAMTARCQTLWAKAVAQEQVELEKRFMKHILEGGQHEIDLRRRLVDFAKKVAESFERPSLGEASVEGPNIKDPEDANSIS
ncbi:hypothetical protein TWF718_000816 [Orbilia javanica]|uniref:Uncharacterized protein n=1 Tax=Orbilia javanica TaxID=47235 RepID=A0AAN8RMA7_9PEZI